jgi:hypothetical protein
MIKNSKCAELTDFLYLILAFTRDPDLKHRLTVLVYVPLVDRLANSLPLAGLQIPRIKDLKNVIY